MPPRYRIEAVRASALSVPLREPFVIASGRVDVTPNVLVEVALVDADSGRRATGLGEAATLPAVTRETQGSVLGAFAVLAPPEEALPAGDLTAWLADGRLGACTRAGLETALLDAQARLEGRPVHGVAGPPRLTLTSDITIPIGDPGHMAKVARRWKARGFGCFKVKVGKDVDHDLRALELIHEAVPDATYRLDANAGFTASEAIALAREVERLGLVVECWEQPCGRLALDQMAEVAAALDTPVIADESVATLSDLARVVAAKAADGVNLKLVKSGGFLPCLALGREARRLGLSLMVGAMVETRLGITAAAHLAVALGGVEFPDLDTALLLADDPFVGGYEAEGPRLTLSGAPGLGVSKRL